MEPWKLLSKLLPKALPEDIRRALENVTPERPSIDATTVESLGRALGSSLVINTGLHMALFEAYLSAIAIIVIFIYAESS